MHIIKVGLNYKTTPIDIREKLAFSEETIKEAMTHLNNQKSVLENVIFSTCNRTEIYAVVDQLHTGRHYVKQFLIDWFNIEKEEFSSYLEILENDRAIEHLLRVSVGLNSMVLGETQILGQVRDAFSHAQKIKTTGTIFNELFKQAITFAKRTHSNTSIGEQAVSVSYVAVELAKKIFGNIANKRIVIVGAGEMGELTLKNLYGSGVTQITVVNRTFENADKLADKFQAKAAHIDELLHVIQDADILISSTASTSYVLSKEELALVQKRRKGNPLFLVDIAVPRDLDPRIGELEGVFLYDIDDLHGVVDENLAARREAAASIEPLLEAEISAFKSWLTTLGVVPIISALRKKALSIQEETMASIKRKMPELTEREKKVLNKHTKSIINQLLKEPITQVKELAASEKSVQSLEMFVDIFGIDEEVKTEVSKQVEQNKILTRAKPVRGSFPLVGKIIHN